MTTDLRCSQGDDGRYFITEPALFNRGTRVWECDVCCHQLIPDTDVRPYLDDDEKLETSGFYLGVYRSLDS